jgi:hypothetical protein
MERRVYFMLRRNNKASMRSIARRLRVVSDRSVRNVVIDKMNKRS